MTIEVLIMILAGGFGATWALIFYFINRIDAHSDKNLEIMRIAINDNRHEINEFHKYMREHHGRLCIIEEGRK